VAYGLHLYEASVLYHSKIKAKWTIKHSNKQPNLTAYWLIIPSPEDLYQTVLEKFPSCWAETCWMTHNFIQSFVCSFLFLSYRWWSYSLRKTRPCPGDRISAGIEEWQRGSWASLRQPTAHEFSGQKSLLSEGFHRTPWHFYPLCLAVPSEAPKLNLSSLPWQHLRQLKSHAGL
jgi:hypothetical protein